jgi:hypothetical protein
MRALGRSGRGVMVAGEPHRARGGLIALRCAAPQALGSGGFLGFWETIWRLEGILRER